MNENFEAASTNDLKELDIKASPIVKYLEEYLKSIIQILKDDNTNYIESTFGSKISVFGPGKLKLLDIINLSLNFLDDTKIMDNICDEQVPVILFVLYIFSKIKNHLFCFS